MNTLIISEEQILSKAEGTSKEVGVEECSEEGR